MTDQEPAEIEPQPQASDPENNQNLEETRPWSALSETDDIDKNQVDPSEEETRAIPITPSSTGGFEETSAFPVQAPRGSDENSGDTPPPAPPRKVSRPPRQVGIPWFILPLTGVAILLFILLISGFAGYRSGIAKRVSAEKTQVSGLIDEQYQLGIQDMQNGAYDRARQRFEYIIKLDPGYPGASERLSEVLLELITTATPTLLPTATLVPTPDTRDVQQLYDNAQQALAAGDWNGAIENILVLRKNDPAFRTVEVDGMLFLALRNRGRDKILKDHDLEGGIYDLTLAEKFGPLDTEARALLNWSNLYIIGASFWGIDWEQVVNYFSQVAPQAPNLMDASMMTATERLRQGYFEYGNMLAGRGQFCAAVKAYENSLAIAPNPQVQQAAELAGIINLILELGITQLLMSGK